MTTSAELKQIAPELIRKYSHKSDLKGAWQTINTLVPYFALFYLAMHSLQQQAYVLTALFVVLLSFFIVRIFMLMHDCGHKSLFNNQRWNRAIGFLTGVLVGMPQYVWAQHHNFHHATNGDWEKYRGPLNILTVDEFSRLSKKKQKGYQRSRNILLAPLGAFMYFIFNPRFNWLKGSLHYLFSMASQKLRQSNIPLRQLSENYSSRYWNNAKEYWHMTWNNIVLIAVWIAASMAFGTLTFFTVYLLSLSLGGAAGIIIFAIQHNFEDAYASDTAQWDYYQAALTGTSFLTFPKIINWFGADIAYHHVHHLSASIPNYNLAACHREYAHLFEDVPRLRLRDVPHAFKYILWDQQQQKLITVAQFKQMKQS